jgi:hypothetical protein
MHRCDAPQEAGSVSDRSACRAARHGAVDLRIGPSATGQHPQDALARPRPGRLQNPVRDRAVQHRHRRGGPRPPPPSRRPRPRRRSPPSSAPSRRRGPSGDGRGMGPRNRRSGWRGSPHAARYGRSGSGATRTHHGFGDRRSQAWCEWVPKRSSYPAVEASISRFGHVSPSASEPGRSDRTISLLQRQGVPVRWLVTGDDDRPTGAARPLKHALTGAEPQERRPRRADARIPLWTGAHELHKRGRIDDCIRSPCLLSDRLRRRSP